MKIHRVVLSGLLAICATTSSAGATGVPKAGEPPPAHLGTTLDGKPILATDFPGKAIVVSYWATWCSFCIKELALLSAVQTNASDRVQVVTVNIEPAYVFKKVSKGLSRFQMLLLYDPDKKGRDAYGVKGVPHMIIIGKNGLIDSVRIGYGEDDLGDVVDSINRAIGAVPSK